MKCGKPVGSRPYWMGVDQYDQCYCNQTEGHAPPCVCSHGVTT